MGAGAQAVSTEWYACCRECGERLHVGTRYLGGFKFFTIGAKQPEAEEFFSDHACCSPGLALIDEHEADKLDERSPPKESTT